MENKKIKNYLLRTFIISWSSWLILALLVKSNLLTFSSIIGTIIFTIGEFGPTISAISLSEEKITFKFVMNFIFSNKKKSIIYLLIFCILLSLTIGLSSMELNPAVPLLAIPFIFIICTFVNGGNEELGWRGILQPILEKKLAFPIATLVTGIVWSIWHLPLWFIDGTSQSNMPFLVFAVYMIFLSFWLSAVYKRTNCVFYCSILHGLSNLLMSIFILKVNWIFILGIIIMEILSILLWYKKDPEDKKISIL